MPVGAALKNHRPARRPHINSPISELEQQLEDFDLTVRQAALQELLALTAAGAVPLAPEAEVANMHCHTFFSFNAYGYSPSGLAWLARRNGYKLLGSVDFDVLDAVDEFLLACDLAGVRASAGLETRVFVPEFADREINSPGEPGIAYHMGIGFTSSNVPADVAPILAAMQQRAGQRNRAVMARVNAYLDPVCIDYEADVLPLTPAGNPTERHMVVAYLQAAQRIVESPASFWADRLGMSLEATGRAMQDEAGFQNLVRSKLMKRGGVGYVQPSHESFPRVEEFHKLITACGALPCAAWLDGTTAGEQAMEELLDLLIGKGVVALNIVPDRNWNIPDPAARRLKLEKLYEVVELAQALDLPLNVGTEMNSPGNKLMDDFDAPELAPVRRIFLDGAYFIYGHTVMQRVLGLGYQSPWTAAHLPTRRQRNDFYTWIGYRVPPGRAGRDLLLAVSASMSPAEVRALVERTGG